MNENKKCQYVSQRVRATGSRNKKEDNDMRMIGVCPYFQREREHGVMYCECAKFRFPDKQVRRDIVYSFCAHPENYRACAIKQAMDHYYERKYSMIENDAEKSKGERKNA